MSVSKNQNIKSFMYMLSILLTVSNCSEYVNKYKILGKWSAEDDSGSMEFFEDGGVIILSKGFWSPSRASGKYKILSDGRLKMEGEKGFVVYKIAFEEGDLLLINIEDGSKKPGRFKKVKTK
jgi:hypothetical protein